MNPYIKFHTIINNHCIFYYLNNKTSIRYIILLNGVKYYRAYETTKYGFDLEKNIK